MHDNQWDFYLKMIYMLLNVLFYLKCTSHLTPLTDEKILYKKQSVITDSQMNRPKICGNSPPIERLHSVDFVK